MSKKTKSAKPETTEKTKRARPAAKPKQTKRAREPKAATPAFDFIGRVENIRVMSEASGAGCEFALHGRKGTHQSFRLRPDNGAAMMAMAHIVIAAHDKGAKIGVRSEKGGEGLPFAAEIAWRPKRAKAG